MQTRHLLPPLSPSGGGDVFSIRASSEQDDRLNRGPSSDERTAEGPPLGGGPSPAPNPLPQAGPSGHLCHWSAVALRGSPTVPSGPVGDKQLHRHHHVASVRDCVCEGQVGSQPGSPGHRDPTKGSSRPLTRRARPYHQLPKTPKMCHDLFFSLFEILRSQLGILFIL